MTRQGRFVVFEGASKCGKTTLAEHLSQRFQREGRETRLGRCALSRTAFAQSIPQNVLADLAYSTAFFWADAMFYTRDELLPFLHASDGGVAVQDRYDLSILAWREIHGLCDDGTLVEEYIRRGDLITPDLTVFLNPPTDVAIQRIRADSGATVIDKAFLARPELFPAMQSSIRRCLNKFGRTTIELDTDRLDISACLDAIASHPMLG